MGDSRPKDTRGVPYDLLAIQGADHWYTVGAQRVACAARVRVDRTSGHVTVEKLTLVIDAGTIIHPDSAAAQVEGAALWGLSVALYEGSEFVNGQPKNTNLDTYTLLRMGGVPDVEIEFLPSTETPVGLGRRPRSRPPSETRSLSPRAHAFAICQSVLKPCEKRSRIGVDCERSCPFTHSKARSAYRMACRASEIKPMPAGDNLSRLARLVAETIPFLIRAMTAGLDR